MISLVLVTLTLCGCSTDTKTTFPNRWRIFEPSYDATPKDLLEMGFQFGGTEHPGMTFTDGDTTVWLFVDCPSDQDESDNNLDSCFIWAQGLKISISDTSRQALDSLLWPYGLSLRSPILKTERGFHKFFARNQYTSVIHELAIRQEQHGFLLYFNYDKPLTSLEEIAARHERIRIIDAKSPY